MLAAATHLAGALEPWVALIVFVTNPLLVVSYTALCRADR
jgi:hypothetical protein